MTMKINFLFKKIIAPLSLRFYFKLMRIFFFKHFISVQILYFLIVSEYFRIEEAGRYLETYKAFENKPPDLIMEKSESNYLARVII